ncbi:MAG: hypothetical protein AABY22_17560 [Nanoarchaeota archaeon]
MDESLKRKNVLDLQFQKYLTISSTSIIIAFTYLIGVSIAFFTKQIKMNNFIDIGILFIISVLVLGICFTLFFNALFHLRNIPEVVKEI